MWLPVQLKEWETKSKGMQRLRTTIVLRDGVQAELLCTPALYGVALKRGIDLTIEEPDIPEDASDMEKARKYASACAVNEVYAKMLYCAAINAWEVENLDNPEAEECPYKYVDFHEWAWGNQQEFRGAIDFLLKAMTGNGIVEHARKVIKKKKRLFR